MLPHSLWEIDQDLRWIESFNRILLKYAFLILFFFLPFLRLFLWILLLLTVLLFCNSQLKSVMKYFVFLFLKSQEKSSSLSLSWKTKNGIFFHHHKMENRKREREKGEKRQWEWKKEEWEESGFSLFCLLYTFISRTVCIHKSWQFNIS